MLILKINNVYLKLFLLVIYLCFTAENYKSGQEVIVNTAGNISRFQTSHCELKISLVSTK